MQNRLKIAYALVQSNNFSKLWKFGKSLGKSNMTNLHMLHKQIFVPTKELCYLEAVCYNQVNSFLASFLLHSRAAAQMMMVVIMQIGTQIPAKREQIRIT